MQHYVKKVIINVMAVLFCLVIVGVNQTEVSANALPFEIETIIPENQVDKSKTYFDLKLEKGQKQTVEVLIRNITKKDLTVEVAFSQLTTNSNGVMEYKKVEGKPDKSLAIDISTLVKVTDHEVTVKANSEVRTKIAIEAPETDFPGILAGGLTFRLKETDSPKKVETKDQMAINNQYGYDIALVLHGNVPVEELPSELLLSTVGIINTNGRNLIFANLQNPQPKNLKDVTIETKVIEKESSKVVLENKRTDLEVAPNTNFDYGIPLNGAIIGAGTYTLKLAITIGTETFDLEKEFKINAVQAEQILEEATPTVQKSNTIWYVLVGVLIAIGIAGLLILKYQKNQVAASKTIRKRIVKKRKVTSSKR